MVGGVVDSFPPSGATAAGAITSHARVVYVTAVMLVTALGAYQHSSKKRRRCLLLSLHFRVSLAGMLPYQEQLSIYSLVQVKRCELISRPGCTPFFRVGP